MEDTNASNPSQPSLPRKRSIFASVFPSTSKPPSNQPPASSSSNQTPGPPTARKKGSQVQQNRGKIRSERLPSGVLEGLLMSASSRPSITEDATPILEELKLDRRRADSDPVAEYYYSTLDRGFGFDVEEGSDSLLLQAKGGLLESIPLPMVDGPHPHPRLSFARDDGTGESSSRLSINRRSLQLSMNLSSSSSPRASDLAMNAGGEGEDAVHSVPTLRAATLDRLVEYVVTSSEFMEASQVSAFLLTYHAYVDGQGLLRALASRYDSAVESKDVVAQIRTLFVLQRWIEEHYYDFADDEFLLLSVAKFAEQRLKQNTDLLPEEEQRLHSPTYQLLLKLASVKHLSSAASETSGLPEKGSESPVKKPDRRKSGGEDDAPEASQLAHKLESPHLSVSENKRLIKLTTNPPPEVGKDFASAWSKLHGKSTSIITSSHVLTKIEIARQLTLIEHAKFRVITPTDLIAHSMHRFDGNGKPAHSERVTDFIKHFNDVARFVASTICGCTESKERSYMYKKWIKIGVECLTLNNFNAVFEIMAGIHSVAVWRLKTLRGSATSKTKRLESQLENVVSRKNNFAVYRNLLALNQVPARPTVPFIGAALADLSFLQDGNVDTVGLDGKGDALINFAKHRRVAKVMQTLKRFQEQPYMLNPVQEIKEYLEKEIPNSPKDQELFAMSKQCEPPVAAAATTTPALPGLSLWIEWPKVLPPGGGGGGSSTTPTSPAPPPRRGSLATMIFGAR